MREQGTYDKIAPAVLATTSYANASGAGQIPLKEPWVQTAVMKAFPASDLQQKGDAVIDSSFAWLDGTSDKPQFSLDFSANKTQLGTEVGNYTGSRLNGLPACSLTNIPETIDAYTIDCLPFGVN